MTNGAVPRFWREIPQRYNLIGTQCTLCNRIFFPQREFCPFCRRKSIDKMKHLQLRGEGTVIAFSIIYVAPEHFEGQAPYPIAIIELDEGPRLTAQIVDCNIDDVKIGMKVQSTFRKIQEDGYTGAIYYGYKFKKCHEVDTEYKAEK